jgi:uncharacterized protein YhfF
MKKQDKNNNSTISVFNPSSWRYCNNINQTDNLLRQILNELKEIKNELRKKK